VTFRKIVSAASEKSSDTQVKAFMQHLLLNENASPYTLRNYQQALSEFIQWHEQQKNTAPAWRTLGRDDFRNYLRSWAANKSAAPGHAAVQRVPLLLQISRTPRRCGKFTDQRNRHAQSGATLPHFLTGEQILALLRAPVN